MIKGARALREEMIAEPVYDLPELEVFGSGESPKNNIFMNLADKASALGSVFKNFFTGPFSNFITNGDMWDKLIPLGGAILNGIFGSKSQSSQNAAMLKANRETNEMNYRIYQEQKAHNIDMFNMQNQASIDAWNRNNEYNTPDAVAERYRDAGLNPALMMTEGGKGGASSAPSTIPSVNPTQTPSMQAPPVEAFKSPMQVFLSNSLQGAMASLELLGRHRDNVGKDIANDTASSTLPLLLSSMELDNSGKRVQNWVSDKMSHYVVESAREDYLSKSYSNQQWRDTYEDIKATIKCQRILSGLSVESQEILNRWLEPAQQQNYINLVQQGCNLVAQEKLTYQELRESATRALLNMANKANVDLDTKIKKVDYRIASSTAMSTIMSVNLQNSLSIEESNFNLSNIYDSDDSNNRNTWWWNSRRFGEFMRNAVSGWFPMSASYNVTKPVVQSKPKSMPRIGFAP